MSSHRGPNLPYVVIAGVTPWSDRWLVASAKLHGSVFAPEEPRIFESFATVLDERPSFAVVVVNAPIGYVDAPGRGSRKCEIEARALLGVRAVAVHSAPSRATLEGTIDPSEDHLDAVTAMMLPRYREVAAEMSPYRQRLVYEGHPEMSFFQLNADNPLRRSKKVEAGRVERRLVLQQKLPGIARVLDAEIDRVPRKHFFDVAALLWSARRIAAHAAKRLPEDPEWDSQGLRMEYVY